MRCCRIAGHHPSPELAITHQKEPDVAWPSPTSTTWSGRTFTSVILPLFLLTVAALDVHMAEEYLARFGPAMSRLFDISWTERSFLLIFAFVGPCLYALTAIGLYYRVPLAGFVAWFIFIGPGVAEFTHFIFPLLKPALDPTLPAAITAP